MTGGKYAYDQHDPPADGGAPTSQAVVEPSGTTSGRRSRSLPVTGAVDHDGARLASYYVLEGELEIDGERAPTGAFVAS